MKLAIVTPGGVDRSGEARVIPALLWFVERLARRHEVHVFALSQEPAPGEWELLGARVHNTGTRRGRSLRLHRRFAALHRERPFDLVQAIFGWSGAYAAGLGWRYRLPVAVHAAGDEFVALRDIGYGMRCSVAGRLALRVAVAGARRVTVPTPYAQALALERGVTAEVVPFGVALDRWPRARPRLRDRAAPARLLHVGDIRAVKDQATLLAAAGALLEAGVPFELDIAGFDTTGGALRQTAAARSVERCTRWHGVLGREALRALMDRADLLVVTSRHEAGSIAALEAAVAGVAVVGTAVGHLAEWAPAGAATVNVGDAPALAREIAALLADDERRMRLAGAAQAYAVTHDADFTAAAFEELYARLRSGR